MSDKLELQIPLFEKNASVGLVFSDAIDFFQDRALNTPHFAAIGVKPPRGRIFDYLFLMENYPISMPTAVFRKSTLDSLHEAFDIRYRYAEEYDLFLRMAYHCECDYVDKPLAVHRIHGSSSTVRFHRAIPDELSSIMQKILQTYPQLESTHGEAIVANKKTISLQLGKSLWQDGKTKDARKVLGKYIGSAKIMAAYVATFLPYKLTMRLWNLLGALRSHVIGAFRAG